jgi:outer membrane protein TolC
MKKCLVVLFTIYFIKPLYSIDFEELKNHMLENSKQLQIKKYDIDISNEDLNIVNSDAYPSISIGYNIENSESLTK